MDFYLQEFNPRRWVRGAAAARMAVANDDGTNDLLWMSERDVRANIKQFGLHRGLLMALGAYATPSAFYPPREDAAATGRKLHEDAKRMLAAPELIDPGTVAGQLVQQYLAMDAELAVRE